MRQSREPEGFRQVPAGKFRVLSPLKPMCKVTADKFLKLQDIVLVYPIQFSPHIRVDLRLLSIPVCNPVSKTVSKSVRQDAFY